MFCDVVAEYFGGREEFGLKDVQFCDSKKNEADGHVVVVNEEEVSL